jgi:hypothetical protein
VIAMRTKQVQIAELPDSLLEEHAAQIASFSVALAKMVDAEPEPRAELLGSGTLVKHHRAFGILTARHVAELIRDDPLHIVLGKHDHRFQLSPDALILIRSDRGATDEVGPDLAFIRLPDAHLGTIKARKSLVDLEIHREKAEAQIPGSGLWCVFGFPNERRSVLQTDDRTVFRLFGQCGVGPKPESYSSEGDFDYYTVRARYSESNDLPESYGGVSGGGLWHTQITRRDGVFEITGCVLRGVAFYQSARRGDSRFVKCHGDRSIYSWLSAQLTARFG